MADRSIKCSKDKRREVLDVGKLIFFEKEKSSGSGFRVRFLSEYLEEFAPLSLRKEPLKAWACVFDASGFHDD